LKALLDTHTFLWSAAGDPKLSGDAYRLIEDRANSIVFSAASAYEIAIKVANGRLTLSDPPAAYVPARIAAFGFDVLSIEIHHSLHAASLPALHRDPWDRLLVAQAQLEGIPIITADSLIARYDVETIW